MAQISKRLSFIFSIAIAIAYAGCGAPQQTSTPLPDGAMLNRASRPLPRSAKHHPRLYIGDDYNGSGEHNNAIDIFPLTKQGHQKRLRSISNGIDGPWGLSVDANDTLYVANGRPYYNNGTVTVYPYGSSNPSMTYSAGLHQPLFAVADSAKHVFVADRQPGFNTTGYVVEYNAGTNAPIKTVRLGIEADGLAEDTKGNLYVAYRRNAYNQNGTIAKFAPGLRNKRLLGMTIQAPQGLLVDRSGNVLVVESSADRVDVFPPAAKAPSVTVQLPQGFFGAQLAMRKSETTLWVSVDEGYVYSMPYPLTARTKPTLYEGDDVYTNGIAVTR
ncbi:MAG: hypothetical protein WBE79_12300 [Candidatus Cybelea sp.]